MILEQKIGFDKVRSLISSKCQTQYALQRVDSETISTNAAEINHRLLLTDEMRLICMFEDTFPSSGYIDAKVFLLPLQASASYIDVPSLGQLRTFLDTLRKILHFFKGCKDDLYPNLRELSQRVVIYPELDRKSVV